MATFFEIPKLQKMANNDGFEPIDFVFRFAILKTITRLSWLLGEDNAIAVARFIILGSCFLKTIGLDLPQLFFNIATFFFSNHVLVDPLLAPLMGMN